MSFVDVNTVRSKQRARGGDIRRRRRIKLKRDPVRNVINDAGNQITEHKPDKNNFRYGVSYENMSMSFLSYIFFSYPFMV